MNKRSQVWLVEVVKDLGNDCLTVCERFSAMDVLSVEHPDVCNKEHSWAKTNRTEHCISTDSLIHCYVE